MKEFDVAVGGFLDLMAEAGLSERVGTLAQEWVGVEAGSVLPTSPELLGMVPAV